jgi:hypothetical protein
VERNNQETSSSSGERALGHVAAARELRITPQNTINYTLDNAMALSVILAREETRPWFYESYVQLYSLRVLRRPAAGFHELAQDIQLPGGEVESIAVHFAVTPAKTWFSECRVKKFFGSEPDDIISFIAKSINLGCYLRLEMDEYHLPDKRSFGRRQWVHPTLVYGYDDEAKAVLGLGFDTKSFTKLSFSYDDVRRAYDSARRITQELSLDRGLVSLIRMREPPRRYPFSVRRFLRELEGYISSTTDSARKYYLTAFLPASVDVDAAVRLGFGVYDHFEEGLRRLLLGHTGMTYASMHALFEHKRFLLEAFRFIISEYGSGSRVVELADDFQRVVAAFNSMRWKYIRYDMTKDPRMVEEVIEQLASAKAEERELLQRIHEQMQSDYQAFS